MIKYRRGFKFQLSEGFVCTVHEDLAPEVGPISIPFIRLGMEGRLVILAGYAWDGPSRPAFVTRNFMQASLVHDALYELIRKKFIPFTKHHRRLADLELIRHAKASGMSWIRRQWVYIALRTFAAAAADPKNRREEITT